MSTLFGDLYNNLGNRLRQYARLAVSRVLGTCSNELGAYKSLVAGEEGRLLMRAEITALTQLIIDRKLASLEEVQKAITDEMAELLKVLAMDWPEVEVPASGVGFTIKDLPAFAARAKREGWPP